MAKISEIEIRLREAFGGRPVGDIAAALEIPYSTLKGYLSGRRDFPVDLLVRIAVATDCSLNWLLMGVEPKFLPPGSQRQYEERAARISEEFALVVRRELVAMFQGAGGRLAQTVIANSGNSSFTINNQS